MASLWFMRCGIPSLFSGYFAGRFAARTVWIQMQKRLSSRRASTMRLIARVIDVGSANITHSNWVELRGIPCASALRFSAEDAQARLAPRRPREAPLYRE